MSEFIGSRISLISRSDIRYVGILHEINSDNSTVALEQVVSYGTEGRRGDPTKEIPATDNVYEYIVFRGSDVKDLKIEEAAKTQQPKPPQVLDDPAILQSTTRPPSYPQNAPQQYQAPAMHTYYQQTPQARYGYPPNPYGYNGYAPVGPPGVGQFPPQPPLPQQQQPQPIGGFTRQPPPPQTPIGPATAARPQQAPQPQQQQQPSVQQPPQPIGSRGPVQTATQAAQQPVPKTVEQQAPKPSTPAPPLQATPQVAAKTPETPPSTKADTAKVDTANQAKEQAKAAPSATAGQKSRSGIVPALPLASPAPQGQALGQQVNNASAPSVSQVDVGDTTAAVQDLARKVSQLKASSAEPTSNGATPTQSDNVQRPTRQPMNRGRGGFRGGFQQSRKVDVPATDYDFESANAKFNKQDLIKEVIASEDITSSPPNGTVANGHQAGKDEGTSASTPILSPADGYYSKSRSFFDNISCENKDRAEGRDGDRQRRGEETKKNIETFGQGSVDGGMGGHRYGGRGGWRGGRGRGGYRGGYRGRGSGRGGAF